MMSQVRVRIPPSPTGNLHVGTARAALFNELFAGKEGGKLILRLEDTDRERSKPVYEKNIIDGLKWLGITWDEGPVRQSERGELYKQALQQLLAEDRAYSAMGEEAIRLRVKPQTIIFRDLVRGDVATHTETFGGDFVIARSLTSPLYHLAVVVDDAEMKISHVIRGEDHISNTARQILLQRALGYPTPTYAHLPLLVDEKRRKLSKRAGDTDLLSYRERGYLPAALLNYLALLGWNPKNDREFFTHKELRAAFSLEGIQKGSAMFSLVKLQAVNKHYLRLLSAEELLEQTRPWLQRQKIKIAPEEYWQKALQTEQERVATLEELAEAVKFFADDWPADYPAERLVWRKGTAAATKERLQKLGVFLKGNFSPETLQQDLLRWIDGTQLGRGDTLWPMRVALTGREHSPGPFEVAEVLGQEKTLIRLTQAIKKL
jgi:glutamyl-tRNA synthetase